MGFMPYSSENKDTWNGHYLLGQYTKVSLPATSRNICFNSPLNFTCSGITRLERRFSEALRLYFQNVRLDKLLRLVKAITRKKKKIA